jgi:hypothetical protein
VHRDEGELRRGVRGEERGRRGGHRLERERERRRDEELT